MLLQRFWIPAAVCIAAGLQTSCVDLTLPRFDGGVLNPEIRFLRAGEIMEGVKCAMVAFMHERETMLMERRVSDRRLSEIEAPIGSDKYYSPYEINIAKEMKTTYEAWSNASGRRWCGPNKHLLIPDGKNTHAKGKVKGGNPEDQCVENDCDAAWEKDCRLGASVWDHSKKSNSTEAKGCTAVPDISRFALDNTQTASIQLTLTGLNSGFINYMRIDALRTPFYPFIQPGNSATGAPFPALQVSGKGTTIFDMTGVMPQSIHTFQLGAAPYDIYVQPISAVAEGSDFNRNERRAVEAVRRKEEASEKRGPTPRALAPDASPPEINLNEFRKKLLAGSIDVAIAAIKPYESEKPQEDAAKKLYLNLVDWKQRLDGIRPDQFEAAQSLVDQAIRFAHELAALDARAAKDIAEKVAVATASEQYSAPPTIDEINAAKVNLANLSKEVENATFNDVVAGKKYKGEIQKKISAYSKDLDSLIKAIQKPPAPKFVAKQFNEFGDRCHADAWSFHPDDKTRIDYLALKKILNNVVEEQEKAVYRGIPDVTLSQLVLTSAFQVVLEASAGTTHLFRIVPVLVPPNTDLKADHTHQLKVTLNGKKQKGDKQLSGKLADSCRERVSDKDGKPSVAGLGRDANQPTDFCGTEAGRLLESIVQALEKGSSSAGQ